MWEEKSLCVPDPTVSCWIFRTGMISWVLMLFVMSWSLFDTGRSKASCSPSHVTASAPQDARPSVLLCLDDFVTMLTLLGCLIFAKLTSELPLLATTSSGHACRLCGRVSLRRSPGLSRILVQVFCGRCRVSVGSRTSLQSRYTIATSVSIPARG